MSDLLPLELAAIGAYQAFAQSSADRLGEMPPWGALPPEARADWRAVADAVQMVGAPHIAAAAAAAERECIRQLAIEHGAVCAAPQDPAAITGTAAAVWHDPPPLVLFAGLIEPAP